MDRGVHNETIREIVKEDLRLKQLFPEHERWFKINGLLISGIEAPKRVEVDQDFVLIGLQSEPESCIACLRLKTAERVHLFATQENKNAEERILNFVAMHSLFTNFEPTLEQMGAISIEKSKPLGTSEIHGGKLRALIPEDKRPEILKREYSRLEKSIESFKSNESTVRKNPYLMNALHYFYYGLIAERYEEKLIDSVISLEALYMTDPQELGYRLSMRVASLIGWHYENRTLNQIAKETRNLYNKRSRVVHGEPETLGSVEISHLMDYNRRSLLAFLELSPKFRKEQIIEIVDDAILGVESRELLKKLTG
jgi:hypothetical protein